VKPKAQSEETKKKKKLLLKDKKVLRDISIYCLTIFVICGHVATRRHYLFCMSMLMKLQNMHAEMMNCVVSIC
jgi:hypothetical protein